MPRFVILTHDHPTLHWDLMLEHGGVLRTWRLQREPQIGVAIAAQPLPDHRLAYLDYEGPVRGNRGTVVRWDRGTYELLEEQSHRLAIRLEGARIRGMAEWRWHGDEGRWLFTHRSEGASAER